MGKVCPKISLYEARRAARLPPVTHSSGLPRLGAKRKREPRATTRSAPRGPPPPRRGPPPPAGPHRAAAAAAAAQWRPLPARGRPSSADGHGGQGRAGRGHRSLPPPPVSPNPAAVRRWEPQPPPGYAAPGQPAPFRDKSKLVTASYGRWRGGGESSPEGKWPLRVGIAISCPAGPGKPLPRGREQPGALQNLRP